MTRRLVWSGFVVFDHRAHYARACDELTAMHSDNRLIFATDMKQGIEQAPAAIDDLYDGRNSGKSLIYIG